MPWKACWLIIASAAALVLAHLPPHLGATPTAHRVIAVSAGLALCGVWLIGVKFAVDGADMWTNVATEDRALITWCLRTGGGAYTLWVIVAVTYPEMWWVWLAVLAGLGVIAYWVATGLEFILRTRANQARARAAQAEQAKAEARGAVAAALEPATTRSKEAEQFVAALKATKLGYLRLIDATPLYASPGEPAFGYRYRVRRGPNNDDIGPKHAESIAIALADITGRRYLSDQVETIAADEAGEFDIVVTEVDIMARVFPHTEPPRAMPPTIQEPREIGFGTDAQPVTLNLRKHGRITAGTTGGKSSLLDEILAALTECPDSRVWICGTHKLYDLVAPWCEIYRDTGKPIPFDWVRFGPRSTADMLAAFLRVSRYRQSLDLAQRGGWPHITLVLDEASYVMDKQNLVTSEFDGMDLRTPELTGLVFSGVASADQNMILATQRDTFDRLGDAGGTIVANLGWDIVGRSTDRDAIGRVAGSWDLRRPRHPGQFWLVDFEKAGPVQMKAKYPQTDDPTKPRLIRPGEGMTVSEIAWSRRLLPHYGEGIDAGSARAAGQAYLHRPRYWDKAMQDYIRGMGPEPQYAPGSYIPPADTRAAVAAAQSGPTTSLDGPQPDDAPTGPRVGPTTEPPTLAAAMPIPATGGTDGVAIPKVDLESSTPADVFNHTVAALAAQYADLLPPDFAATTSQATSQATGHDTGEATENPVIEDPAVPQQPSGYEGMPSTRAGKIVMIVGEWQGGGPVSRAKILAELHEVGDTAATPQLVSNALTKLVSEGVLTRADGGYTVTPGELTHKQTHTQQGGVMTA